MKQLIFILVSLLLQSPAFAAVTRSDDGGSGHSAWGKTHFLYAIADLWQYEEIPDIMKDSGALPGFNYTFRHNFGMLYMEASAEGEYGRTTYEGHTMQTNADISFTQTNMIYMGQAFAGVQIHVAGPVHIIPKVGYLYRFLKDFDDDASGDYRREQTYYAVPVGLDVLVDFPVGKLAVTTWYTADFRGQNQTFMTDVGGDRDPRFKQDKGYGFLLEGSYMYDIYTLGGFVRYWSVDTSNQQFAVLPGPGGSGFYVEPENRTVSIGIKGGVAF